MTYDDLIEVVARICALEARIKELEQMNDAQEAINKRTNEILEAHTWKLADAKKS